MTDPKFKRQIFRFASPRQQLMVLLPVMAMLIFGAVVSFSFMGYLRDGAVTVMAQSGLPQADILDYERASRALLGVYWAGILLLSGVGFYWGWLVSHRIFGPFARLKRDLDDIRQGIKEPSALYVREDDYVADLIQSIREALLALKRPGPK